MSNSTGSDKKKSFDGEQEGSNVISIGKGDDVPKTVTNASDKSVENIKYTHTSTKRSMTLNPSSLPAKKRLKLNNWSYHHDQEEEEKQVLTDEESSDCEGEEEITSIVKLEEPKKEEIEEATKNNLWVMENQALLRRQNDAEIKEEKIDDLLVVEHQALPRRIFSSIEEFDEPIEEKLEELDEEEFDEPTTEVLKEASEIDLLIAEHDALLKRNSLLLIHEFDEPVEEEQEEPDEEEFEEPVEKELEEPDYLKEAREMALLVAEHQALLRRQLSSINEPTTEVLKEASEIDLLIAEHDALLKRNSLLLIHEFDEPVEEEQEEPDEEEFEEPVEKELEEPNYLKEAREMALLVAEHQALLRRQLSSINEFDEPDEEELEELDELTDDYLEEARNMNFVWKRSSLITESDEPTEEAPDEFDEEEINKQIMEAIKEARENEHQALFRRKMGLQKNAIDSQNQKDCDVPVDYDCTPQHWRGMSADQKARANKLALQIQMGNPAFVHVLKRSCVTKKSCIVVPKNFSGNHLPEKNLTLVLRRPEKEDSWSVRYYFRKSLQSIEGSSWVKFERENNLREGDVCMFELVDSEPEVTFIVHISQTV